MTIWTKEKCDFLKDNWGKATARELAEQMGPGFTRNSIIGKASRLGLSAKIKTRTATSNQNFENNLVISHEDNKLEQNNTLSVNTEEQKFNFVELAPLDYEIDNITRKELSSVPIQEIDFPKVVYMVVNKNIELEIKLLKDYPDW